MDNEKVAAVVVFAEIDDNAAAVVVAAASTNIARLTSRLGLFRRQSLRNLERM